MDGCGNYFRIEGGTRGSTIDRRFLILLGTAAGSYVQFTDILLVSTQDDSLSTQMQLSAGLVPARSWHEHRPYPSEEVTENHVSGGRTATFCIAN